MFVTDVANWRSETKQREATINIHKPDIYAFTKQETRNTKQETRNTFYVLRIYVFKIYESYEVKLTIYEIRNTKVS